MTITIETYDNGFSVNTENFERIYQTEDHLQALADVALSMGVSVGVYKEGDADDKSKHHWTTIARRIK